MRIYLAGGRDVPVEAYMFSHRFDRLFSYVVDKWAINKYLDWRTSDMKLFFAGYNAKAVDFYCLNMGICRLFSYGLGPRATERYIEWAKAMKDDKMKIYFTGSHNKRELEQSVRKNLNYLVSYAREGQAKGVIKSFSEAKSPAGLFIDSGAFTVWTKGKKIDVDKYIKFINDWAEFIELYGQVDSIPGEIRRAPTKEEVDQAAQATWENYLYMRPKMKKPEGLLYTFHVGEDFKYLKQALDWKDPKGKYIPYIALGGMVGKNEQVKFDFMEHCFDIIKQSKNPKVKVHAFGMTAFDLLEQFPIESADSSSWIMVGSNGGIMTSRGVVAISEHYKDDMGHVLHLGENAKNIINPKFGFTFEQLMKDACARIVYNASYVQDWVENKYKFKGLVKQGSLF